MRGFRRFFALVLLFSLAACAGGGPPGSGAHVLPASGTASQVPAFLSSHSAIFVADQSCPVTCDAVTGYPVQANGNVAPASAISGLSTIASGIAIHNDYLYVTTYDPNTLAGSIEIFRIGSGTPSRVISGSNTGLFANSGIAVDAHGYIYVTRLNAQGGGGNVAVFAPDAAGNVAPGRVIAGSLTLLSQAQPIFVALDETGNIYVSGVRHALLVFAAGSHGNVAPIAVISNPSGGLSPVGNPAGVAVDENGKIYVVAYGADNAPSAAIVVLSPIRSGAPKVIATLDASSYFGGAWGPVGVDVKAQTVFVSDVLNNSIDELPASAAGNVVPTRVIIGPNTAISTPNDVKVAP